MPGRQLRKQVKKWETGVALWTQAHKLHLYSPPPFSLHLLLNKGTEGQFWRNQAFIWNKKSKDSTGTHKGLGRHCTRGWSMSVERWNKMRFLCRRDSNAVWRQCIHGSSGEWVSKAGWPRKAESIWEKLVASRRVSEWGSISHRGEAYHKAPEPKGMKWDVLSRKIQSKHEEEGVFTMELGEELIEY